MEKYKIKTGGKIFGAFLLGVICTSGVSYAGNTGLIGDLFELVTNPDSTQNLYIKDNAFKDDSINADALEDGSVGLDQIGGNQIVTGHIQNGTIKNQDLEGGITSDKISSLETSKLSGTISNDQLAGGITGDKLGESSVGSRELFDRPEFATPLADSSILHVANKGYVDAKVAAASGGLKVEYKRFSYKHTNFTNHHHTKNGRNRYRNISGTKDTSGDCYNLGEGRERTGGYREIDSELKERERKGNRTVGKTYQYLCRKFVNG